MTWDFDTDADFQRELDWVDDFVAREVEPLDMVRERSCGPATSGRRSAGRVTAS